VLGPQSALEAPLELATGVGPLVASWANAVPAAKVLSKARPDVGELAVWGAGAGIVQRLYSPSSRLLM
jgi:hypothetical protein